MIPTFQRSTKQMNLQFEDDLDADALLVIVLEEQYLARLRPNHLILYVTSKDIVRGASPNFDDAD